MFSAITLQYLSNFLIVCCVFRQSLGTLGGLVGEIPTCGDGIGWFMEYWSLEQGWMWVVIRGQLVEIDNWVAHSGFDCSCLALGISTADISV